MVLGMLAVLMLLAVSFSVVMRIERAGTTNLRNALTSRQALMTALTYAAQAIDESVGEKVVADWENGLIASSGTGSYTEELIGSGSRPDNSAMLVTAESAKFLTPSQEALARNANARWGLITSGMAASKPSGSSLSQDTTVGRYAFVVLDATGYLDMNIAGGLTGKRNDPTDGTNSMSLVLTSDASIVKSDTGFFSKRDSLGGFTSFNDLRNNCTNEIYFTKPSKGGMFLPELFSPSSTISLESLTPDDHKKKVVLSPDMATTYANFNKTVEDICDAFKESFEYKGDGWSSEPVGNRKLKFYSGNARSDHTITRARLATVGLLDYIDSDKNPGKGGSGKQYWSISIPGDDSGMASTDPLDFPCTEQVPLINQAVVYIDGSSTKAVSSVNSGRTYFKHNGNGVFTSVSGDTALTSDDDPSVYYIAWDMNLYAGCQAVDTSSDGTSTATLTGKFEFESLGGRGGSDELAQKLNGSDSANPEWYWNEAIDKIVAAQPSVSGSGSGKIVADDSEAVTFRVYGRTKTTAIPEETTVLVKDLNWPSDKERSALEKDGGPVSADEYESISLGVTFTGEVKVDGAVVQQVPGPECEARLYMLLPFHHHTARGANGSSGDEPYEFGWAMCLDPHFAFDPSFTEGNGGFPYWMSNYNLVTETGGHSGGSGSSAILDDIFEKEANDSNEVELNMSSRSKSRYTYYAKIMMTDFSDKWDSLNYGSNDNKSVPDALHKYVEPSGRGGGHEEQIFSDETYINEYMDKHLEPESGGLKSVGELGNIMIGPWETVSLFYTKSLGDKYDFHPVLDYFTLHDSVYPKISDSDSSAEHKPARFTGRVNLNAPKLVKYIKNNTRRGEVAWDTRDLGSGPSSGYACGWSASDYIDYTGGFNPEPIATVFNGMSITGSDGSGDILKWDEAMEFASAFVCSTPEEGWKILSGLGCGESGPGEVLSVLMSTYGDKLQSDYSRESFIRNSVEHFTTRGQTYIVLLRADAYSPKFGSSVDGTTLASSYAIAELWRDPEPVRTAGGEEIEPKYHNWVIRSFRILE